MKNLSTCYVRINFLISFDWFNYTILCNYIQKKSCKGTNNEFKQKESKQEVYSKKDTNSVFILLAEFLLEGAIVEKGTWSKTDNQ